MWDSGWQPGSQDGVRITPTADCSLNSTPREQPANTPCNSKKRRIPKERFLRFTFGRPLCISSNLFIKFSSVQDVLGTLEKSDLFGISEIWPTTFSFLEIERSCSYACCSTLPSAPTSSTKDCIERARFSSTTAHSRR